MLTIVFIKRHMQAGAEKEFFALIKKLRSNAMGHDGYISGETLSRYDRPGEYLVISTWQSVEDWQAWEKDSERQEISRMIDSLLGSKADYQVYVYG